MADGIGKNGFEIGVSDKPRLGARRFFDESAFAVVHGDFVSLFCVRKAGADLRGGEQNVVGDFSPVRADEHVRAVVFLRVQPDVVGRRLAQEPVVLHVVSARKDAEFSLFKGAEGDGGRIFHLFLFSII